MTNDEFLALMYRHKDEILGFNPYNKNLYQKYSWLRSCIDTLIEIIETKQENAKHAEFDFALGKVKE